MPTPQPRRSSKPKRGVDADRRGNSASRGKVSRRDGHSETSAPRSWGSVARKGAASVRDDDRRSTDRFDEERSEVAPERTHEVWIRDKEPRSSRKSSEEGEKFRLPDEAISELAGHVGAKRSERLVKYLRDAAKAYAAERWSDSRKSLKVLLAEAPDVPTVKELNAMLLYRTGNYKKAVEALRDAHVATVSFDLYPALMDSYRALKNYAAVQELWDELRAASPSAEVIAEGRIVAASALADQDKIATAISVLTRAPKPKNKIGIHHLRTWYVLGDLYDRSGEVGLARSEFQRIVDVDEGFADTYERLQNLG